MTKTKSERMTLAEAVTTYGPQAVVEGGGICMDGYVDIDQALADCGQVDCTVTHYAYMHHITQKPKKATKFRPDIPAFALYGRPGFRMPVSEWKCSRPTVRS